MSDSHGMKVATDGFRLRGAEMSRIDAFSDVVFGFALTLLVVSLEVPKSFEELQTAMHGFLPFAICFLFLLVVWHSHYIFFKRFGLQDTRTILLNSILLFVVLFYVYPLKFLFTLLLGQLTGTEPSAHISSNYQVSELMILYGVGYAAVQSLFALLYWNGWRQKEELRLNALERLLTRSSIIDFVGVAAIALLSCLLSLVLRSSGRSDYAGYVYFLIAPWKTWHGMHFGRKARLLAKS